MAPTVIFIYIAYVWFSFSTQYFPDRFVRRKIQNLEIVCTNSKAGCNWEGKFQEYETHVRICEYGPKPDILPFTSIVSPTNSLNEELMCMDSAAHVQDSHHNHMQELLNSLGISFPIQAPHNELEADESGPPPQSEELEYHLLPHQLLTNSVLRNHLYQFFSEELRSKEEEIVSLRTQVTKLEKEI